MIRFALLAFSAATLGGCALSSKHAADVSPTQTTTQPAAVPVAYQAAKFDSQPKSSVRSSLSPRALVPCFGASPLASPCRWDRAIDQKNEVEDIRTDVASRKSMPR